MPLELQQVAIYQKSYMLLLSYEVNMMSFINIFTFVGADFIESNITVTVPRSEYDGLKEIHIPQFLEVVDDDVNEAEQIFAVMVELGGDVRERAACFLSSADCYSRAAATEVHIIDNDSKFFFKYTIILQLVGNISLFLSHDYRIY